MWPKNEVRSAIAVMVGEKGFLCQRRKLTCPYYPNWIELPGGKVENFNEKPKDALAREVMEETGVEIDSSSAILFFQTRYNFGTISTPKWIQVDFFFVPYWYGTPEGKEGQQILWVPPEGIHIPNMLPLNRIALDLFLTDFSGKMI